MEFHDKHGVMPGEENRRKNKAKELATLAIECTLKLDTILDAFETMETENDYLHCCDIHTVVQNYIKDNKHNKENEKVSLEKLSRNMFDNLFRFERDNP